MYKIFNSSKVRLLGECDGTGCYGGKPLPYAGWNSLGNLYPRLIDKTQLAKLKNKGFLEVDTKGVITLYVLDKAMTKEGKLLIGKQLIQSSDILAGKYLKEK